MRIRRAVVVVLGVLAVVGACERKREPRIVRLGNLVEPATRIATPRVKAVADRPEVGAACSALMDAVIADQEVANAAGALFAAVIGDPAVTEAVAQVNDGIGNSPEVAARRAALAAAHPELTADQLAAAFTDEYDQADLEMSTAAQAASSVLLSELDIGAASGAFWSRYTPPSDRAVSSFIDRYAVPWSARLIALDGGHVPDPARAATLLIDHALTEDRLARAATALCNNPAVRRELTGLTRGILAIPALRTAVTKAAHDAASDPDFQRDLVAMLVASLRPDHETSVPARVNAVFRAPVVRDGASAIARAVISDPTLGPLLVHTLDAIWADPAARKTIVDTVDGW
jgi:hypothetical protein